MANWDYMENCIHLKACRRLQKLARQMRFQLPRYCTEECSAYVDGSNGSYVSTDEAISYARGGVESIRGGYDSYDVYCSGDLCGKTLSELVNEDME